MENSKAVGLDKAAEGIVLLQLSVGDKQRVTFYFE